MNAASRPVPPEKSHWQGKSVLERQGWTEDFFIEHPNVKQIVADFLKRLDYCERSKMFATMLIIGGSGSGKTTLARRLWSIAKQRYDRYDNEKTICPVIQFAVPDPCTPFEFSVAVLTALGDRFPRGRKNRADTKAAAERLLHECEVRLILVDNFQDIPARRATRGIELVGTRLRDLIDCSAALWVFLGTSEAERVVHRDTQLIKRISYRAYLNYFGIETKHEIAIFARLLVEIDKWLPLAKPSCLVEPKLRGRFYCATEGIFDRIVLLLDRGWIETVNAGREIMILSDMAAAYVYVHGPRIDLDNPFHPNFNTRKLRGDGDPFNVLQGA